MLNVRHIVNPKTFVPPRIKNTVQVLQTRWILNHKFPPMSVLFPESCRWCGVAGC